MNFFGGRLANRLHSHVAAYVVPGAGEWLQATLSLGQSAAVPVHAQRDKNVEVAGPGTHFDDVWLTDHGHGAVGRSHHHAHERTAWTWLADGRRFAKNRKVAIDEPE